MGVLDTFLYEAIFIPEGFEPPHKDIIKEPELQAYVDEFGSKAGDICFIKEYRGHGIGTELMKRMIKELRTQGYKKASLSVQKSNYAVRLYKRAGFEVSRENEEEYIMICHLQ